MMFNRTLMIALALLVAPVFTAPASANPGSEAKVWYVPEPSDEGLRRAGSSSDHLSEIFVTNLSGDRARVAIRTFDSEGKYIAGGEHDLTSGARFSKFLVAPATDWLEVPAPFSYVLVISNRPVIVNAKAKVLLKPLEGPHATAKRFELCQKVTGAREKQNTSYQYCPGDIDLNEYATDGAFQTYNIFAWQYVARFDIATYPIDCDNAPTNHFACSQRLPTLTGGGGPGAVTGPKKAGVGPAGQDPAASGGAADPATGESENGPAGEERSAPPSPGGETISAGMDDNTDRPTADLVNFQMPPGSPERCKQACDINPLCRAWSYVRPGYSGHKQAVCRLKSSVPDRVASVCCVSGVK